MCQAMAATMSTMIPMAPAIETMKSCGGVFLISATAFFATWRGCTFGFSGGALLNTAACTASCSGSSGGGGGGGGTYTCLRGGNSSISEKLRVALTLAWRFSDIIGSRLILGASTFGASTSGSTTAADDIVADGLEDGPEDDSTENVSIEASAEGLGLMTGAAKSRLGVMSPALAELAALPPTPAAAAAALFA